MIFYKKNNYTLHRYFLVSQWLLLGLIICCCSSTVQAQLDSEVNPFDLLYRLEGEFGLDTAGNRIEVNPFNIIEAREVAQGKADEASRYALFTNRLKTGEPAEIKSFTFFWTIIPIFLILAVLSSVFPLVFVKMWKGIRNFSLLKLYYRDAKRWTTPTLLLPILYISSLGTFLFLVINYFGYVKEKQVAATFILCLLLVCFFVILRKAALFLLGELYQISKEVDAYLFVENTYQTLLSLTLLPFTLLLAFTSSEYHFITLIIALIASSFVLAMRVITSMRMSTKLILNNIFQFFIYLCTIEIIPFLIGCKYLLSFTSQAG